MPDTGSGRTCVCLSGRRGDPLQLPFLQESALPEVPAGGCRRMAQSAATAQAPFPLFSADVHAARGTAEGRGGAPGVPSRKSFFLPVKALALAYRAKCREGFSRETWFQQNPAPVWRQDWV